MRSISGLLIFVFAIFIVAEARKHHWKRRTTTTTEKSTSEIDSSEELSMDLSKSQASVKTSRPFSTTGSDTTQSKKKAINKKHSHKSATAHSTTTEKARKSGSYRSTDSTYRRNVTVSSLTVTIKPVNMTKNMTASPRVAHSTEKISPVNSLSSTPGPTKTSTTHSQRALVDLKKTGRTKKRHHLKTLMPPTKKSMNATVIATNSTTVIPSVSKNNTKSSRKPGHKKPSSSHKTTKTGITSKTLQSSTVKPPNNRITAISSAKKNDATKKAHNKVHNSTSSNIVVSSAKAVSANANRTGTTLHLTNSKVSTTTKPTTNSTVSITNTAKKSKVKKSRVNRIETTITRPVTTSPQDTLKKINVSSSGTAATVNSTIHRSNIAMKSNNHSTNTPHLTSALHLPINSTNKLAITSNKTKDTTTKKPKSAIESTMQRPITSTTVFSTSKSIGNSTTSKGTRLKMTTPSTEIKLKTAHPTGHKSSIHAQPMTEYRASNFSYVVKNTETGIPCILSGMSISMTISYETTDHAIAQGSVVVPKDAITDGNCSEKLAVMRLTWCPLKKQTRALSNNNLNTIILNFINDGKMSSLDSMFFEFYLDKNNFPGAIGKILRGKTSKSLGLFMATVNKGHYICNVKTNINAGAINVNITDVSLITFNKDKNLNLKKEENCTAQPSYKKIAVIGGAIGIILVIGILGTCMWRRKIRPYDSSTLP